MHPLDNFRIAGNSGSGLPPVNTGPFPGSIRTALVYLRDVRSACYCFKIVKASLLYRISSILLLLFAAGHTWGFRQIDPKWGVDSLVQSMKTIHFNANGFDRTYYDFFVGFGLFVTVLMLFASIIAWQFGSLPAETLAAMRVSAWGFVVCFAAVSYLCWRYVFIVPVVFSIAIFLCLAAAAWLSGGRR
jgi:hypothetical protein